MSKGSPGGIEARAQSESIGSVLLLGVVIVSVSAFGVFFLSAGFGGASDAAGGSVNVVGDVSDDAVELAHGGGRSLPLSDLRVVVEGESGRSECGLDSACESGATALDGDGDDRFDAGETWRLNWFPTGGAELTVTLVDDGGNRILYRESFRPTTDSETPGRAGSPTATATPTDDGRAPSAVARGGSVVGRAGETLTLDGAGTTDADGDALVYGWRIVDRDGLPENATRIVEDTVTTPNATFEVRADVTDRNRTLTVELGVSDGSATATEAATVDVEKYNRAPVADARVDGDDSSGDRPAMDGAVAVIELDGSGSYDPDGDDLTYRWEVVEDGGLGDALELSDRRGVRPALGLSRAVAGGDRTATVRLTVTDDDGATDADTVDVDVPAGDASGSRGGWNWRGWLERLFRLLFG